MTRTLLGLTILWTSACTSTLTGNEGNFQFSYPTDDRFTDFNKPIAVGAFLDLEVRDVGARQPVTLSSAAFDDPSVLSVVSFADQHVTIEGIASGQALLEVAGTTRSGASLTDSVNLLARVPEVQKLWHTCDETGGSASYLVSSRAWIPFDLEMANGQPVIGYGYYPVTASSGVLGINETDSVQSHVAIDIGDAAGAYTLDSDLDATSLAINVVTPAEIDGVMEPLEFVWEDIDVGDTNAFYVLPSVGGEPVCQANVANTVVSDTEEICSIDDRTPPNASSITQYEWGWFDVTGVSAGTCQFTVTYPTGNDGAGASASFEVTIEP